MRGSESLEKLENSISSHLFNGEGGAYLVKPQMVSWQLVHKGPKQWHSSFG